MKFISLTESSSVESTLSNLPACIALDTEYTHRDVAEVGVPDPRTATLLSIVIAFDHETSYSIPASLVHQLLPLVKCSIIYLQNFKVDYEILARYGLDLTQTKFRDTMLMHHLIDENPPHSLDYMVTTYFGDDYKTVFWGKYNSIDEATPEDRLEYECKDAIYTYKLGVLFDKVLKDRQDLVEHVHRLALSLYWTETEGLSVDCRLINETKDTMGAEIEGLFPAMRAEFLPHAQSWEMQEWVKELDKRKTPKGKANVPCPSFNFGSDRQLSWLMYQSLELPVLKRTKRTPKGGGNLPSVDYETFELLEAQGHYMGSVKKYKQLKNLYGTFVLGLLERVEDGYIYPEFNVNGTATGRISHSNPNMGNMPKEGPFRNFFLPGDGMHIFGADYAQLEIILEANLTKDPNTVRIITEGASKHDITAVELKIPRELAKTINFAMGYRCSPFRIQKILKCSANEAQYLWNKYWETYHGVRELQRYCDKRIAEGLPIVNPFGRERHLPTEFENEKDRARAQRQGYNALIQGTGGDCMNRAFYLTSEELRVSGKGRMLFSVHDEGVGESNKEDVSWAMGRLVHHMQSLTQYLQLDIPLTAVAYGPLDKWAKV